MPRHAADLRKYTRVMAERAPVHRPVPSGVVSRWFRNSARRSSRLGHPPSPRAAGGSCSGIHMLSTFRDRRGLHV